MNAVPATITSRDNPLLVRLRKLARGHGARPGGEAWLEGDHLCRAALARGQGIAQALITTAAWSDDTLRTLARRADRVALVSPALFASVSGLGSPAAIGFVLSLAAQTRVQAGVSTVVLDRLQDPGNVGSILRSAAALGVRQVLSLKGTVGLWSPKVLRAGMGAHFALQLVEGADAEQLDTLAVPCVATSSHGGVDLPGAALPYPCAWIVGHEGQGVDAELRRRCALHVRIPQPGGEESLNVAAATAICLYEGLRRRPA